MLLLVFFLTQRGFVGVTALRRLYHLRLAPDGRVTPLDTLTTASGCSFTESRCRDLYEPGSNGLALWQDPKGKRWLLACRHGSREVAAWIPEEKQWRTIAHQYAGKPLNSPNDLVVDNTSGIYFTDPPYGRPLWNSCHQAVRTNLPFLHHRVS